MSIRLLAIDLDGTLLNSAKRISAATAACLQAARETKSVQVVLASARPPRSMMGFYSQLRLETPMINYNGALVYEPPSAHVLLHRPLPLEVARGVVQLARRIFPQVLVSAEILDRWYTDRFDRDYNTATGLLFEPDVVAPVEEWLTQPVTKLLLLGPQAMLMDVQQQLHRAFPYQVSIVQTETDLLQIMHATAGKAHALRTVAAHLHVRREEVLAIGDQANDVGMLQWAGVAVAVANAAEEVKAVADYITGHHDHDGVAKAVRQLVLAGLKLPARRVPRARPIVLP